MGEGRAPSRAVLVISGLLTQLIGSACLVLGLASIPVMHDLHRPFSVVLAWIGASLGALLFGGLSYRARPVALGLAAVVNAGFGYMLPRKDSALGALAQLLPVGDVQSMESIVGAVAIGMFVVAALCLISIPLAVRYRRWEATDEGIRMSRTMMAVEAPPEDTLPGVGRAGPRTMVIRTSALQGRSRLWVIVAVAATLVGTGAAIIVYAGSPQKKKPGSGSGSGSSTQVAAAVAGSASSPSPNPSPSPSPVDAAVAAVELDASPPPPPPPPVADSPANLVAALHDALTRGDAAALGGLLATDALAIGPEAADSTDGRDAAVALLLRGGPAAVEPAHTTIGQAGKLAWITEELAVTPVTGAARHLVTSMIATPDAANHWAIAAVTWAIAVPNDTAFRLARDNRLPVPAPLADRTAGADELTEAARTAFGSREGFAAARSKRADAFNYGSAPGERMVGGAGIQRAFAHMTTVQMALHDGLVAVPLGATAGYTEANVDFTAPDTDGAAVTQTFRVLAAWLREDGAWHIVLTQFSNAKPGK